MRFFFMQENRTCDCKIRQRMVKYKRSHDRAAASPSITYGRGCVVMSTYEIIMIILGILGLLICFGQFLIALLTFLDKRNKKHKK